MAKLEINSEICKSCNLCVHICPKNVLEIGKKLNKNGFRFVNFAHPDDCIGCCMCATMCPDCAIEVYK